MKIPVKAQKQIELLERRLQEALDELAARKESRKTNTVVNEYGSTSKFYLPDDSLIHFYLGDGMESVSVRRVGTSIGPGLEISLIRGIELAVLPRVANVVHVAPAEKP